MARQAIPPIAMRQLAAAHHKVEMLEQRALAQDPTLLLRRGYSITMCGGHAVRDAGQLKPGDEIETRLEKGRIKSTVK